MTQLTDKIREQLLRDILEGRFEPGGRFPTELETAQRFSASRVTIRRAYAELEAAGIIVRRRRCGTMVNDCFSAATGPLLSVGALVPLTDAFSREFLDTLCSEAAKQDAMVILEPASASGSAQSEAALRLASNGVRNFVVWGVDHTIDFELFRRLRILGINLVFFDRIIPENYADYVGLDNHHAIKSLMNCAVAKGYRNFVFLNASGLDVDSNREREEIFLRDCEIKRLPHRTVSTEWNNLLRTGQSESFKNFFKKDADIPTAVIGANATLARSAIEYAGKNYGFFCVDSSSATLEAGITSYSQPMREMAKQCFAALSNQRETGKSWRAANCLIKGKIVYS